jgi:hypothetical protein
MIYVTGTSARCAEIREAVALADGLPRRVTVVGGPDMLPTRYTPGAPGWTEHLCPAPVEAGDGTAAIEVPPEADRHLGKTVRVRERDVVLPAERDKVDEALLEQKFRDALPPRDAVLEPGSDTKPITGGPR